MDWLISANKNVFDHYSAFKKWGYVDWQQIVNYEVGDIVYIYIASPVKKIQFKTKVLKANLTANDIVNDKEFWLNSEKYSKGQSGHYVRLELIQEINDEKLSLKNLKLNGLKAAPQGPMKLNNGLKDYIESVFTYKK